MVVSDTDTDGWSPHTRTNQPKHSTNHPINTHTTTNNNNNQQGLYHPARRVREVYWKLYNSLYIFAVDALTPAYPRVEDEAEVDKATGEEVVVRTYRRTTLELFI